MLFSTLPRSLQGLACFSLRSLTPATVVGAQNRTFASVLPDTLTASKAVALSGSKARIPEGHSRPHLGVEGDSNHGLYGFFRRIEKDGQVEYETLQTREHANLGSSRPWSAAELRRKSFKDLHTLWYVLLRERNLLATQQEEGRRLGIFASRMSTSVQSHKVRKSMARIKYVINERRLAYEQAIKILEEKRLAKLSEEEKQGEEQEEQIAREEQKAEQKLAPEAPPQEVNLAVEGLFAGTSQNAKRS
ncbi:uncharacterized protein PHACADRAFT_265045 [Phanerochaete carnosa HHB-10118-sp]|uniref:Large ribosomal subunit protein uL29m n=1 Tax=Phanerochaete carnosa (strain HHB-10118-sp) TaxID=650164 RepID=K5VRX2_PHACS|nr:uncharacterized protein PHACADRAFT_265045 [Phanerochaete carnosa HHB-10118-sp]EKM49520.1 hypothetical protein PHACADRAFT_265045 [Phanerochaete carnosa HHB-10118-sp]